MPCKRSRGHSVDYAKQNCHNGKDARDAHCLAQSQRKLNIRSLLGGVRFALRLLFSWRGNASYPIFVHDSLRDLALVKYRRIQHLNLELFSFATKPASTRLLSVP